MSTSGLIHRRMKPKTILSFHSREWMEKKGEGGGVVGGGGGKIKQEVCLAQGSRIA